MLFLTGFFYKTWGFFPRQRLWPSTCITCDWGVLFVCLYFFLLLPLLLSELTMLKVNVALVPAESVLWKESLFILLLKISFKRSKKCNAFLINQLEKSLNPYTWKEVLGTCFLCCSLLERSYWVSVRWTLEWQMVKGEICSWSTVYQKETVFSLTSLVFCLSSFPWILFQSLLFIQSGEIYLL